MAKKRYQIITYNRFINKLRELYYENNKSNYAVKWYMQLATFSYEIYHKDEAFHGKSVFESEVFWHGSDKDFRKILNDIDKNLKELNS